jgi:serine/threonine-protein kinase
VVALPESDRGRALAEVCGSDTRLRREVESLLAHEPGADDFLNRPALVLAGSALDPDTGAPADDAVGTSVGPWRIERRIASGGMGSVYLAVRSDGQFRQQVAIKVVKRGMDSEEVLRRFAQERRTLGALDHPNIARLLDAGVTADGRPALVMEYVPGTPISEYCDEHRLGIDERLRLFRTVCEAVRAAHRVLVVHRDLKPGNILVTPEGVPKLLDFGIAKLLAEDSGDAHTIAAERRLTPEYASPEQVAGRPLTTATDVYSLGVILYELLTGRRPYKLSTRSAGELERVIGHQTPPPPSEAPTRAPDSPQEDTARLRQTTPRRLRRALAGDLDNIVLMAMRKEPERRYQSVEQLAMDIDRHLGGLPVIARPDTLGYRTTKFLRRHAVGMSLTAAIALLGVTAVGAVAWQSLVARGQRDAAYLARDQSEQVVDFLRRMLLAADPANEGPDATIRAVLDHTALTVESELQSQPLVRAAVQGTIGQAYLALGLVPEASHHLESAFDTRMKLLGPDHHDVAESRLDLARLRYEQQRYTEAETLLRESLGAHEILRGRENFDTARVMNDRGAVLRAEGRLDEAEELHRKALAIRTHENGPESLLVAESLNNLAGVLAEKGDLPTAVETSRRALEIRRKLYPPKHPLVFQSLSNLGVMVGRTGDYAGAERLLREAVDLERQVLDENHPDLARSLSSLAGMIFLQSRPREAETLYREALRIREAVMPADSTPLATSRISLGRCLVALGKDTEAADLMYRALAAVRDPTGTVPASQKPALDELTALLDRLGRTKEAAEVRDWAPQ